MDRLNAKPSTATRRWPYILLGIASSALVVWAGLWGAAEIIVIGPARNIAQWEQSAATITPTAAEESKSRLQTALKLNGGSAKFYMLLARLDTLQANVAQAPSQDKQHHQNQAIENLKRALSKRPSWGLAWAKLAQAYAADPKQSTNLIQALERALYFEAYEELSQQHTIPLAIAQWEILPNTIKEQIKTIIPHALRYQPSTIDLIANTATAHGWEDELAPLLTRKWHKNVLSRAIRDKELGEREKQGAQP